MPHPIGSSSVVATRHVRLAAAVTVAVFAVLVLGGPAAHAQDETTTTVPDTTVPETTTTVAPTTAPTTVAPTTTAAPTTAAPTTTVPATTSTIVTTTAPTTTMATTTTLTDTPLFPSRDTGEGRSFNWWLLALILIVVAAIIAVIVWWRAAARRDQWRSSARVTAKLLGDVASAVRHEADLGLELSPESASLTSTMYEVKAKLELLDDNPPDRSAGGAVADAKLRLDDLIEAHSNILEARANPGDHTPVVAEQAVRCANDVDVSAAQLRVMSQ